MHLRTFLVSSFMVVALSTAVTPARAQDAQAQAAGRTLFNEGVALFNKGDFERASAKLEASLAEFPGIGTRGKLAECYEKLGRYASAWHAYREVARLATRNGDPVREQVASARARALEPRLSYVTITVPASHDVPGLVVKKNGAALERAKLGSAEPMDAGNVTVEVSAPGRTTFLGQVTIAPGQSARLAIPALALAPVIAPAPAPGSTSSPAPPAPASASAGWPSTFTEPPAVQRDAPAWHKPVGLVLLGVGVVGLGAGGVLGLSARATYEGAFEGGGCDRASRTCNGPGQASVDDARSQATLSTILFAAGGAFTVAGAVVLLTKPSPSARALTVSPVGYAGGAGLSLAGSL